MNSGRSIKEKELMPLPDDVMHLFVRPVSLCLIIPFFSGIALLFLFFFPTDSFFKLPRTFSDTPHQFGYLLTTEEEKHNGNDENDLPGADNAKNDEGIHFPEV